MCLLAIGRVLTKIEKASADHDTPIDSSSCRWRFLLNTHRTASGITRVRYCFELYAQWHKNLSSQVRILAVSQMLVWLILLGTTIGLFVILAGADFTGSIEWISSSRVVLSSMVRARGHRGNQLAAQLIFGDWIRPSGCWCAAKAASFEFAGTSVSFDIASLWPFQCITLEEVWSAG